MQVNKEKNIYRNDIKIFLLFIKSIIKKEKLENVVNEPKTPIIRKYLIIFEEIFLFSI